MFNGFSTELGDCTECTDSGRSRSSGGYSWYPLAVSAGGLSQIKKLRCHRILPAPSRIYPPGIERPRCQFVTTHALAHRGFPLAIHVPILNH
jgi:hypothetical protein